MNLTENVKRDLNTAICELEQSHPYINLVINKPDKVNYSGMKKKIGNYQQISDQY